jgi:hypothetical protein
VNRNIMGVQFNEHFRPFHFSDRKGAWMQSQEGGPGCKFRKGTWMQIQEGDVDANSTGKGPGRPHTFCKASACMCAEVHSRCLENSSAISALQKPQERPSVRAGEFHDLTYCRCCVHPEGCVIRECSRHLVLCREILGGVHQAWASLGYISFRALCSG